MVRQVSLKWWFVIFGLAGALFVGATFALDYNRRANINSFEECKEAGYPILESYPEQCIANGRTFTDNP